MMKALRKALRKFLGIAELEVELKRFEVRLDTQSVFANDIYNATKDSLLRLKAIDQSLYELTPAGNYTKAIREAREAKKAKGSAPTARQLASQTKRKRDKKTGRFI